MKFYKIQMLGRFISEYVADVSALSYNASLDKGRILYDETTDTLYFGDDGNNQFSPMGAASIPSTEIILFEKNTAVSGYTLLTSIDDETVFISKGAGSAIGPGATSTGSWTTLTGHTHPGPSHQHTGPSHTHTVGSHFHKWFTQGPPDIVGGTGYTYAADGVTPVTVTLGRTVNNWGLIVGGTQYNGEQCVLEGYTTTSTGSTGTEGTGATGADGTGATGASAAIATWRPAGRIFTRQQKI